MENQEVISNPNEEIKAMPCENNTTVSPESKELNEISQDALKSQAKEDVPQKYSKEEAKIDGEIKENPIKEDVIIKNNIIESVIKIDKLKENEVKENEVKENEIKVNDTKENEMKDIDIKEIEVKEAQIEEEHKEEKMEEKKEEEQKIEINQQKIEENQNKEENMVQKAEENHKIEEEIQFVEEINEKKEENKLDSEKMQIETEIYPKEEEKNKIEEKNQQIELEKEKVELVKEPMEVEYIQVEEKEKGKEKEGNDKIEIIEQNDEKKEKLDKIEVEEKSEEIRIIEDDKSELVKKDEKIEQIEILKEDKNQKNEVTPIEKDAIQIMEEPKPTVVSPPEPENKAQNDDAELYNLTNKGFMKQFCKPNDDNSKELLEMIKNVIDEDPKQIKMFQKKIKDDEKKSGKKIDYVPSDNEDDDGDEDYQYKYTAPKKMTINTITSEQVKKNTRQNVRKKEIKKSFVKMDDSELIQMRENNRQILKSNVEVINLDNKLPQKKQKTFRRNEYNLENDFNDIRENRNIIDTIILNNQKESGNSIIDLSSKRKPSRSVKRINDTFYPEISTKRNDIIKEVRLIDEKPADTKNRKGKVISEVNLSDSEENIAEATNEETNNNYNIATINELSDESNKNKKEKKVLQAPKLKIPNSAPNYDNKDFIINLLATLIKHYGYETLINCIIKKNKSHNDKLDDFIDYLLKNNSYSDIIYCLIKCKSDNGSAIFDNKNNNINKPNINTNINININNQDNKGINISNSSLTSPTPKTEIQAEKKNVLQLPVPDAKKKRKYTKRFQRTEEPKAEPVVLLDEVEEDLVDLNDESINDNIKYKKDKKPNVKNSESIQIIDDDDDSEINTTFLGKKKTRKLLDYVPDTYGLHYHKEQDGLIFVYEFRKLKDKDTAIYVCSEVTCPSKAILYLNKREFKVFAGHSNYYNHKNLINTLINDSNIQLMNKRGYKDVQITEKNGKKEIEWFK